MVWCSKSGKMQRVVKPKSNQLFHSQTEPSCWTGHRAGQHSCAGDLQGADGKWTTVEERRRLKRGKRIDWSEELRPNLNPSPYPTASPTPPIVGASGGVGYAEIVLLKVNPHPIHPNGLGCRALRRVALCHRGEALFFMWVSCDAQKFIFRYKL